LTHPLHCRIIAFGHPAMPEILVIEDDALVGKTLVDLLSLHGYAAQRAESGEQGLERLVTESFDLVLLDIRLPGMSGYEICERIRDVHGPYLPVIMLTAFGDPTAVRRGYEAGADDFLHKPVDTPALILKVRAFLRLKSLHDELVTSREEAQARARDLARLHEIGRDWSLIAEPEDFNRMVTARLAGLIGAPVCGIALYDASTRTMEAALPVHGLGDQAARRFRYAPRPEYRSLWSPRTGRPYVSNEPGSDTRLTQEIALLAEAKSVVLVPMFSEGDLLGLLGAADKPGGFTDADVQLLSIFAGPVATFLRSRHIFTRERRHASRLERLATLVGDMASVSGRGRLLDLTVKRIQKDLGYDRVSFHAPRAGEGLELLCEAGAGTGHAGPDSEALRWALRLSSPLEASRTELASELAVPVRAGDHALGVLVVRRRPPAAFEEEETNLLSTLAGHLALALRRSDSEAATEHMARQMATLYDLGLETAALRDLRALFIKATEEAGRLIGAEHTSVFRFDEKAGVLRLFAAWAREPGPFVEPKPTFRLAEGIAGRVAQDLIPVLINDAEGHESYVARTHPMARILCVPLTHYDRDRESPILFGVLNATRQPGSAPFTSDDLDYLTRFAGQLSIAVANSVAFAAERTRSEQLALVNALLREIAGNLSRERILGTAVHRIHEAFRHPVVSIMVPDHESGLFKVAAVASRDPRPEGWASYPLTEGVSGRALAEKRTILVADAAKEPDYSPWMASARSGVCIPILSGDEAVAVLDVESDLAQAFDRGQVITLETLADGIGIILRNAELFQALEGTNARLVELDRMKSELVNIVAHDFRAPLSAILGWAEVLELKPDAPLEDRMERTRAIVKAATRMASLMDKTLETTRLETGHFAFDFGLIDLGAKVREAVARQPDDPSHRLVLDLPDHPLPCWADGERLIEVLDNLLSNAVKYSPDGGDVKIAIRRERDIAVVSVIDRGIGIALVDREKLFRPFSRLHDRKRTGIEGFGLGLHICERIINAHGGRLTVDSRPGEGSTFSFSLPLFGAAAQSRAPLVIVAARDAGTRREVRRVAEELGYGIHEVTDGVEAVEAAIRLIPAALVLDRVLPRLRAEEVAERLRDQPATAALPLFALANPEDLGEQAALFRACVPKPLDRRVLAAALERLGAAVQ
jgi:signal transduction histidine kinase/DNA-binding response OmpR family regulator